MSTLRKWQNLVLLLLATSILPVCDRFCCAADAVSIIKTEDYQACGVSALYVCSQLQGYNIDLDRVAGSLADSSIHSLAELEDAASGLGIEVISARVKWGDLLHVNAPAILHLSAQTDGADEAHFIALVAQNTKDVAWTLDLPEPPKAMTRSQLEQDWTGHCLIVLKDGDEKKHAINYLVSEYGGFYASPFFWVNTVGGAIIVAMALIDKVQHCSDPAE